MGHVERWKGTKWRARFRTPEGAERSRVFAHKEEARRFLVDIEHSKQVGAFIDPRGGKILFRDYAEQWRTVQAQHRATTAAQVETDLRRHVVPSLGDLPIGSILPSQIQGWVAGRAEVLQPATVERVYRLAVRIFHAAMRDRLIAIDPCVGVRLPRVEPARVVPLTVGEVERLAGAIAPRYQALVILGATAGLRQGEAFGLTVDRVDFLRRTIKVDRQLVLLPGAPPRFGPPKTRTSHRVVPVDQVTTAALAAHLEEFPTDGVEGLVFTASEGGPLRRNRFSERVWRPAIQASGLSVGVTFHDLRHFYASLLIRYGESITTIQARLGHATAAETLGTYGHLWPDSEDRTRAAVAEAFAGRLVRPTHSLSSPHARRTRGGEAEEVGTVDFAARP